MEINLLHLAKMTVIFTAVEILILFLLGLIPVRRGSLLYVLFYILGGIIDIIYYNVFACIFLFFMASVLIIPYFITLSPIIAFIIKTIIAFYLNLVFVYLFCYLLETAEDLWDEYRQRNESDVPELKF